MIIGDTVYRLPSEYKNTLQALQTISFTIYVWCPVLHSKVVFEALCSCAHSASFFKIKQTIFWTLWSRKYLLYIMKISIFWGELTDVSGLKGCTSAHCGMKSAHDGILNPSLHQCSKSISFEGSTPDCWGDAMYLYTTVPHPYGHSQLQELLGNQCYHYHYLRLAYLEHTIAWPDMSSSSSSDIGDKYVLVIRMYWW